MSGIIHRSKSSVELKEDKVIKKYNTPRLKTSNDSSGPELEDILLGIKSSKKKEKTQFFKEAKMLECLTNNLEDDERLLPELYSYDSNEMTIEMEKIKGNTYLDLLVENFNDRDSFKEIISQIPKHLANLHKQLYKYQDKLIDDVKWGNSTNPTIGLQMRTKKRERERLWHYLRAIIYFSGNNSVMRNSIDSSAERARQNYLEGRTLNDVKRTLNRDIKNKVEDSCGIKTVEFTERVIDRENIILYDIIVKEELCDTKSLLEKHKVQIIHGDLGPHHIFEDGRYIDLDEARIGPKEKDLVSLLYNIYTYQDNNDKTEVTENEKFLQENAINYFNEMLIYQDENWEKKLDIITYLISHNKKITSKRYKVAKREVKNIKKDYEKRKTDFILKVNELRLKEYLRLFAVTCKATNEEIEGFTRGMDHYKDLIGDDLKSEYIDRTFKDGLNSFMNYWLDGNNWTPLYHKSPEKAQMFYDQLEDISKILKRTSVL